MSARVQTTLVLPRYTGVIGPPYTTLIGSMVQETEVGVGDGDGLEQGEGRGVAVAEPHTVTAEVGRGTPAVVEARDGVEPSGRGPTRRLPQPP